LKSIEIKHSQKQERERRVLLGLVHCYIKTGRPVGSASLQEAGFDNLSSATIRNYFAKLEKEGFLIQQHTSGGRLPTAKAYHLYAETAREELQKDPEFEKQASWILDEESKSLALLLQKVLERLSAETKLPLFFSAPRFDQDYITALRLVPIDASRCLCVIITDFGVVRTEILHLEEKMHAATARRIEAYFNFRLTGYEKPENLTEAEEKLSYALYNEVMVRYLVNYANFIDEEIYRTGLSQLLAYAEMQQPEALAHSLALFENSQSMQLILRECTKANRIKVWIEKDLITYSTTPPPCAVLAIPYCIKQQPVGAIGLLGPMRLPYRELLALLSAYADAISTVLTRSVYKYKIAFRQPHHSTWELDQSEQLLLEHLVNRHTQ
jgi:heat-inducible transcriptional repressor